MKSFRKLTLEEESVQIQQIEIFCCYAHEDLHLLNQLKAHLSPLQRQGVITLWSDAEIRPGTNWQAEIRKHLNSAQLLLLLLSPAFMQSDYCYSIEMQQSIERHVRNEAIVIPIILRPTLWEGTPLGILQALPPGAMPITLWNNIDEALYKTAEGIQNVVLARSSRPITSSSNSGSFQQPIGGNSQNPLWRSAQTPSWNQNTDNNSMPHQSSSGRELKDKTSIQTDPIPPAKPSPPLIQRRISRRTVLGGVTGLIVVGVTASGLLWQIRSRQPTFAPSPTPPPVGTMFHTYRGHSDPVNAVAWSPDGQYIASGSDDNTVQVWNASSGQTSLTYHYRLNIVLSVAWSPNSKYLASSAHDGTVKVWDASNGQTLFTYPHPAFNMAWSPNGRYLVSGGDKIVQVWDAFSGQTLLTYTHHTGFVLSVAWSPDGQYIASGSVDGTVRVWNATGGSDVFTFSGHFGPVFAVAWSPDSKRIASGGDDHYVQVWDAFNGNNNFLYGSHSAEVFAVAWSPDGKHIASGSNDKTAQVWNAANGDTIFTYRRHSAEVDAVAWSPDSRRIASGSHDNTVQVWEAK